MALEFSQLKRVGQQLPATWRPSSGAGAAGTLSVSLASNQKSVSIDFRRTCDTMAQFPAHVFVPVSKYAYTLAQEYSSGGGQPKGFYSHSNASRADDYIINVQSGLMRRSWRRRGVQQGAKAVDIGLYNVARSKRGANYPLYLFAGTRFMRDRPLPQKLQSQVKPEIDRLTKLHAMRVRRAFLASTRRGWTWRGSSA